MSGIILSAVELNSSVNCDNGKIDGHNISETSIECDDNPNELENNENVIRDSNATIVTTTAVEDIHLTVDSAANNLDCSSKRQRSPTANSIGSNNISIATLDDDESSVVDSDSDIEDVINSFDRNHRSTSGIVLVNKNVDPPNLCQSSILCANNDIKPNIGSIAVQNSSDITFGNKTFYQGPVTIKQFFTDKNKWKETDLPENDNLGYVNNSTDKISRMQNGKFNINSIFFLRYVFPFFLDNYFCNIKRSCLYFVQRIKHTHKKTLE